MTPDLPSAAEIEHEPDEVTPYRCPGPCGQMVCHKPCTICAAIAQARASRREIPVWTKDTNALPAATTSMIPIFNS